MSLDLKVLQPTGIFDGTKTVEFREQMTAAVAAGATHILIDLQAVPFMDSSGLAALVMALKTARGANRKLYLCSVNDQVRMLLDLTNMTQKFQVYRDRQEFDKALLS